MKSVFITRKYCMVDIKVNTKRLHFKIDECFYTFTFVYIFKCTEFPPTLEKSSPRKDLKLCKKSRVNLNHWGKIRVHYKCGVFL